jgi:hypothetical protein
MAPCPHYPYTPSRSGAMELGQRHLSHSSDVLGKVGVLLIYLFIVYLTTLSVTEYTASYERMVSE